MARTLLILPATLWRPAPAGHLVAGDLRAQWEFFQGRPALVFDGGADEEAAITPELRMPSQYRAGELHMLVAFSTKTATSGTVNWEGYVEAVSSGDTLDLEGASNWDTLNDGLHTLGGTAGDLREQDITLNNKDGVVAGDLVRFGLRRDSDDATNDSATDDMIFWVAEIYEA